MPRPIDKYEFAQAKRWLMSYSIESTAKKLGRSIKTIVQIKNSKTFDDYQDQNKAQHCKVNFSLRDEILDLHRGLFTPEDGVYIQPSAARTAIAQIKEKLLQ